MKRSVSGGGWLRGQGRGWGGIWNNKSSHDWGKKAFWICVSLCHPRCVKPLDRPNETKEGEKAPHAWEHMLESEPNTAACPRMTESAYLERGDHFHSAPLSPLKHLTQTLNSRSHSKFYSLTVQKGDPMSSFSTGVITFGDPHRAWKQDCIILRSCRDFRRHVFFNCDLPCISVSGLSEYSDYMVIGWTVEELTCITSTHLVVHCILCCV